MTMPDSWASKRHPASLEASHESLSLLMQLLGASSVESECQGIPPLPHALNRETREGIVSMLQREGLKALSCPALSLKHDQEEISPIGPDKTSSTDVRSRQQEQGNAAALLAREIRSSGEEASDNTNGIATVTSTLSKIPEALLGNIYESFAVLVDSRLRVYSNFLALQGVTLASKDPSLTPADARGLEQKVEALLVTGSKISVDSVSTHFEESGIMEDDDEQSASSVSLPFLFRLQINLIVPRTSGETERVNVSLSAPGKISGVCLPSSQLEEAVVEIDTSDLLAQMMSQASHIVGVVAAVSNSSLFQQENSLNKILRSESTAAMPPPVPQLATHPLMHGDNIDGLDLLSKLAAERPVVSPDLSARYTPIYMIPRIRLDAIRDGRKHRYQPDQYHDKTDEEVDLAEDVVEDESFALSPDQCAAIVDCIFGDLDDVMLMSAPTKKPRIV